MAHLITSPSHTPYSGAVLAIPNYDQERGYLVQRIEFGEIPTYGGIQINYPEVGHSPSLYPVDVSAFALRAAGMDIAGIGEVVGLKKESVAARVRDAARALGACMTSDYGVARATAFAFEQDWFEAVTPKFVSDARPENRRSSLHDDMQRHIAEGWDFPGYIESIKHDDVTHPIEQQLRQDSSWLYDRVFVRTRRDLMMKWQLEQYR